MKKQKTLKRDLAKTVSYRIISSVIGVGVVWVMSGSLSTGIGFGVAEVVYKPLQYFIHERIWHKIKYGKHE